MPTEHEYKYVLNRSIISKIGSNVDYITQGYLKGDARIRKITKGFTGHNPFTKPDAHWYFTFKQKVNDRIVEIETKINERDGSDLMSLCTNLVTKARISYYNKGLDQRWDVDIFYNGQEQNIYFVMAEIEMKEGEAAPTSLPHYIKENLLYEVPLTDDRFSSKKLGDVEYASKLYESLTQGGVKNATTV